MNDPEPQPRPGLFTNGDWDAWRAQVRFLRLVVRMPLERIAAIDYGITPEHEGEEQVALDFAAHHYRYIFKDEPDLLD